jgi:hypothetical protein
VLERAQPAAVVGLVPQLGAGVVEGQDPQVVHVKGSEVAGDLVVECHEWPRGVQPGPYKARSTRSVTLLKFLAHGIESGTLVWEMFSITVIERQENAKSGSAAQVKVIVLRERDHKNITNGIVF